MLREEGTGKVTRICYMLKSCNMVKTMITREEVAIEGDLVTPYEQLTESQCLGWVKPKLHNGGVGLEQHHEAYIDNGDECMMDAGVPW